MAWLRIQLTEEQQRIVDEERSSHPNLRVREKMLVLWLLHQGITRRKAAEIVGVGRATVQRYVAAFREGGLDGLRHCNHNRPVSAMASYRELIRDSFEKADPTGLQVLKCRVSVWGTISGQSFSRGNLWTVPVGTCAIVGL